MAKHIENAFTTSRPGDKPRVLVGLEELSKSNREICRELGVFETVFSQWRRGYAQIPKDKHAQLVELLRGYHAAAQAEAAANPASVVALKAARAGLILKALDAAGDES